MSEKRFRKAMGFIQDNTCEGGDINGMMDLAEIEDMLNELYEENEQLKEENEQLKKQIQNYEQLISNSYVGEEETLDGFVGKYVIWEDELQKYKEKIKR